MFSFGSRRPRTLDILNESLPGGLGISKSQFSELFFSICVHENPESGFGSGFTWNAGSGSGSTHHCKKIIASSRKKMLDFSSRAGREPEEAGGERGQAGGDATQHAGARDGAARQGRHQANRSRDCRQGQGRAREPGSLPGADQTQGQGAQVFH